MAFVDYYKILGVDKNIPQKDVRAAYRKRAKQFHPDLHPNDPKAKAKFQALNEAYEVISDPDKRAKYDQYGEQWKNVGGFGGGGYDGAAGGGAAGGNPFEGFDFSSFGGGGGGPAWGSAYVIMPWAYYCYYGDTVLLNRHYEGMKQWVAYLGTRTDARGIIVREEPDGWCLGDWCAPGKKMELPEPLVNTAYYYHSADLMSKVAAVLGKEEDRLHFDRLCTRIRQDFNTVFFNPSTHHYWEGRQGADEIGRASCRERVSSPV